MPIEVVSLTEADIPEVIDIIQSAFAEDPYFQWVFESSQFNKERNSDSLAVRCRWGINNAIFQVARETEDIGVNDEGSEKNGTSPSVSASSRVVGVSCWLAPQSPSAPEGWYSWYQGWVLSCRQMLNNVRHWGRGGLQTNRYWIWKDRQQEAQSEIWDDPKGYYFCNIVAVRPGMQGMGIGRKLFEAVTDRADREGVKCYLESSRDVPNVQIYEKMGFQMRKEMECRDGEDVCMLYCMVREPKAGH
ncbi:acetyltransferase, GNAT family [Aspergillus ellipticus CBS 707.79]|uniref:Acetyltransferase, GNAT family n=1 Tax=Aspergillus ellipticus CBS 707.79 TaxID=1448320 RepID=A0A319DNT7_9EURO|nr:acetyltransferase, GNAT family [Aspergillus ellipticus CBS 707.79]